MGAYNCMARNRADVCAEFWQPALPDLEHLKSNPVFFVGAQRWLDGSTRLFYPNPRTFSEGYATSEDALFEPSKRLAYCRNFPKTVKPYICRLQEDNTVASTISVLIFHGAVNSMTMEEAASNKHFFNKSLRPLYDVDENGKIFLNTARIVCGDVDVSPQETAENHMIFFHARTTKVIGSNVAVRDVRDPFAVIGASGDCYYVSPPAQAILDGGTSRLSQLVAA